MNLHCRRLAWAVCLAAPMAGALPGAQAGAQPAARPSQQGQAAPRPAAGPEMVTEANVSRDLLKAMYDAAKVAAAVDGGGNLVVTLPQVKLFVMPGKDAVRLLVTYDFAPRASWQERLDLANRINDGYIMARASLPEARPGTLAVDYYVMLGAGVSRANVVALTRGFGEVVVEAIATEDTDRLIK